MDRSQLSFRAQTLKKLALAMALTLASALLILSALGSAADAQDDTNDEVVIFVLDLSGSMNEPFDGARTKLDVAKEAFTEAFTNVSPNALVGLRTYGDQIEATTPAEREPSCTTDTRLASPVAPLQRENLIEQVQGFAALGDTPIGLALEAASGDIPDGATGTIVLFSDGRDECFDADLDGDAASGPSYGDDPCTIAQSVTANDAVDRIVTVGFGADAAAEAELRCIAESTGGSYTAIETPADARDVLPELLVTLSAPREAQRLVGREIQGTTSTSDAPDFVRLDEIGADQVLYTDSIEMNSQRVYRIAEYGPEGGTFTATVFGLPGEPGIDFDMYIEIPELDKKFFQGVHGDADAGLPQRPTSSIRCTNCSINGGPYEAFFVVTLDGDSSGDAAYELELLTEGRGFGGRTTSCAVPQACFYPEAIRQRTDELSELQNELDTEVGEPAPPALIAERDRLRIELEERQQALDADEALAIELEERIPLAPSKSNSFRLPLLLIAAGIGLAVAPVHKLRRSRSDDSGADLDADSDADTSDADATIETEHADPADAGSELEEPTSSGNSWDAELEAAKAAMAHQRPDRPAAAPAEPTQGQFTAEQHAAAKAEALRIAEQRQEEAALAAEAAVPQPALPMPERTPDPAAVLGTLSAQLAAREAVKQQSPAEPTESELQAREAEQAEAAEQAARGTAAQQAADKAAAEQVAREAAAQQAADKQAADKAAAEQAAREAAAQQAADKAAAEQAAREAAAQQAADKAAAEQAAREAAARETAAKRAAEQAAALTAAQQAADKAAAEQAAREAAAQQAADKAAAEQAAREAAAQQAADKAAAEQAAREAAERIVEQRAAQEAAKQATAEQAAREAAQRAAALSSAHQAAEQAAAHQAARNAAEQAASVASAQRAAEQEAAERSAREAAQKAAALTSAHQAAEQAAAQRAASGEATPGVGNAEEAQREEARRRMLAKQNIVASSSTAGPAVSAASETSSTAGTSAALRGAQVAKQSAATTPSQTSAAPPPNWYDDPAGVGQFRWWDGAKWTNHTAPTNDGPAPT